MQLRYAVITLAALALAAPAHGQMQEAELVWKFNKGDKFFQTMNSHTSQTMKIMNQEVKQEQDQDFVFSWTVKDVSPASTVIEQRIESVKMNIKIGSTEIKYDSSAKDAGENALAPFFKPLVGASFTITLGPDMKVLKVEGREEFVKKLVDANPTMADLLKRILSEDQLKQMSEPAFAVVPGKGKKVKPGDTWTRESKLALGPIGTYDAKYTYKYDGTEKKTTDGKEGTLHKISMTTALTYKAPSPNEASGLPFKIEGSDLKATEATGTIFFDAEKGRVVQSEMTVKLSGNLKITVADQSAQVDLTQEQKTSTKTADKNPAEGGK